MTHCSKGALCEKKVWHEEGKNRYTCYCCKGIFPFVISYIKKLQYLYGHDMISEVHDMQYAYEDGMCFILCM